MLRLDGEGIPQPLEVLFQTLNAPPVVGQDLLLNAIQPTVDLGDILPHGLDSFLAGHVHVDHGGKCFNGFYFLAHIYSSITMARGVSMADVKGECRGMGRLLRGEGAGKGAALCGPHLPAFGKIVKGRLHDELADDFGFRGSKLLDELLELGV
jgi:hypothetical protein